MKKMISLLAIGAAFFVVGCGGGATKKVVIMASGKLQVNGDAVNFEPGTQHNEAEVVLSGAQLSVTSPDGKKDYPVTEAGVYLLNLQKDTLIGSIQNYGEANEGRISQEVLTTRMDSLRNLMVGANVSAAKRNFFLPPTQIQKITMDQNAIIRGPFRGIPASIEPIDGKTPEVYKFITNKDARETLERLEKMLKQ